MSDIRYREKGSLTIEAALVIPVFMFAVFMVLSVINLMRFHVNLQEAVHQEASLTAMTAYEKWDADEDVLRRAIIGKVRGSGEGFKYVRDGESGIGLGMSRLNDREIIEINAGYRALLPYDMLGLFDKCFSARCLMHTYTGYEKGLHVVSGEENGEEYVFVTETGTVYHRDRECTYLRLSIRQVGRDMLGELRNDAGHKYYPCEKCGSRVGNTVYITKDGTCYHGSLDCSGLKRTVSCIPLSEVGGRGPCSRCGRRH
ncbi:MAG: pilus assembly protein [Lachnospiraceae bacterium]|nr:pilus assembly protein [Lachnospiraceae bacterium]